VVRKSVAFRQRFSCRFSPRNVISVYRSRDGCPMLVRLTMICNGTITDFRSDGRRWMLRACGVATQKPANLRRT
jgi:hypothetical protein